jgi:hypothetical protein
MELAPHVVEFEGFINYGNLDGSGIDIGMVPPSAIVDLQGLGVAPAGKGIFSSKVQSAPDKRRSALQIQARTR